MTSVRKDYSQRDNRLENITLTGFISDNGATSGLVTAWKPAYAAIDLTKSKNFVIDTCVLTLRNNSPRRLLVCIYINSSNPPASYPNFEFDIIITTRSTWIYFMVFPNKKSAEAYMNGTSTTKIIDFSNEYPVSSGTYTESTGIASFKVLNNDVKFKGLTPFFTIF